MSANRTLHRWMGVAFSALFLLGGCDEWQYDVTVKRLAFTEVRTEQNGLIIGQLKENTIIEGRPCKQGWVHLYPSGVPAGFTAFREIDLGKFTIPQDTWVFQNKDGVVTTCAFPRDTEVQGHLCRGGGILGGSEGVQTAFYADGALKEFFLPTDTRIGDIPCKPGLFTPVELYESGHLKACTLSEPIVREGQNYAKDTPLHFDPGGRIVP